MKIMNFNQFRREVQDTSPSSLQLSDLWNNDIRFTSYQSALLHAQKLERQGKENVTIIINDLRKEYIVSWKKESYLDGA